MTRYFSEDAAKKIADTVRKVENESTDITSGVGSSKGYGPVRLVKLPIDSTGDEIAPSEDDVVFSQVLEVWKFDKDTTDSNKIIESPTGKTVEVFFLFTPDRNRWYQVANMGGKTFAMQDRTVLVWMEKVGGNSGDAVNQCTFRYDIYSITWSDTGEAVSRWIKIASDVDPSDVNVGGGCWKRTEIGKYETADMGLVTWTDTRTPFVIWCNEVFEVKACETSDFDSLRFGGLYDESLSYNKNTLVLDGAYQMVAKQSTRERPAPQPTGEPQTKIGTVPTWAQVSGAGREIVSGQRYTWASGGQLSKVRVYIPTPSGGGGGGPGGG